MSAGKNRTRKFLAWVLLVASLGMMSYAPMLKRNILNAADPLDAAFGVSSAQPIPDYKLVIDSTFSGVERKEGKLWSTYDRSATGGGKRACPT